MKNIRKNKHGAYILNVLLLLSLIGCSVADDSKVEDAPRIQSETPIDSTDTDSTNNTRNISVENDLDADYIENDAEADLGLDDGEPNILSFLTIPERAQLLEGDRVIKKLINTERNLKNDYHQILSLGSGSIDNYEFLKKSIQYTLPKNGASLFEVSNECIKKCKVSLKFRVAVSNSWVLRDYNDITVGLRIYHHKNHTIEKIDQRIINDEMGRSIGFTVGANTGVSPKAYSVSFEIDKKIYDEIASNEGTLLFGVEDVSIIHSDAILKYSNYLSNIFTENKRVSILQEGVVKEYIFNDEQRLLDNSINSGKNEVLFDDYGINSINGQSNTMSRKYQYLQDIPLDKYDEGIWVVNDSTLRKDFIPQNNIFISFLTNLDRFKLAEKTIRKTSGTSSVINVGYVYPFETFSFKLKKNYKTFKNKDITREHKTKQVYRGRKSCFAMRRVFNDSCCGPVIENNFLNFLKTNVAKSETKSCCGNMDVCVDYDITVVRKDYICNVESKIIFSDSDTSPLVKSDNFHLFKNNTEIGLENNLSRTQNLKDTSIILFHTDSSKFNNSNLKLVAPPKTIKLQEGYVSTDCIRVCEGAASNRYRYNCILKSPSKPSNLKAVNKTIKRDLDYELRLLKITSEPYFNL